MKNREESIREFFTLETINAYDWADTYPKLNAQGQIVDVIPADDCTELALVGNLFVCESEHAEHLAQKFGLTGIVFPVAECLYCGSEFPAHIENYGVPAILDNDAWEDLAKRHHKGCEWIATRAFRVG